MNENTNKKISEALGINPLEHDDEDILLPAPVEAKTKLEILRDKPLEEIIIDEDFNEARDNLKDLISKQSEIITQLTMIAEEGESARHYEVLSTMLKNAMEMNDRLLNINKQRKELTKGMPVHKSAIPTGAPAPTGGEQKITVENAIFVGTTAELDKLLEERRKARTNVISTPTVQPKE